MNDSPRRHEFMDKQQQLILEINEEEVKEPKKKVRM